VTLVDTAASKVVAGMATAAEAKTPEEELKEGEQVPRTTREISPVVEPCFYPVVKDAVKPDPQVFLKAKIKTFVALFS